MYFVKVLNPIKHVVYAIWEENNSPLACGLMRCLPFEPNAVCDHRWQRNTPSITGQLRGGWKCNDEHWSSWTPILQMQGNSSTDLTWIDAHWSTPTVWAGICFGKGVICISWGCPLLLFSCFVILFLSYFSWEFLVWLWRVCVPLCFLY